MAQQLSVLQLHQRSGQRRAENPAATKRFLVHVVPMPLEESELELNAALEVARLALSVEQLNRLVKDSQPPAWLLDPNVEEERPW